MKHREGLQPISSAPEERAFDELPQVDRETLDRYHAGISGMTSAMGGEIVVVDPVTTIPDLSPWSQLGRAGLRTLVDIEKRAAEIVGIDTVGM
jgi:hypothetical protein